MRRAVLTLGGTAAGLAALLSLKIHPADGASAGPPANPSAAGGAAAHPASTTTQPAAGKTRAARAPVAHAPAGTTRTITGKVANTQYGPMQVQLTLAGKKITKVTVLQRTDTGAQSSQIDGFAIPKLTSETLAAQSARIDAVSGASYTSSGYIQSLQSALSQA